MMKKLIVVLLFLTYFVYGDILDDKIKNIIGEDNYILHKKLIDNSFKERDLFVYNDKINYVKLFKVLKKEGLLQLKFPHPTHNTIYFEFVRDQFKSFKNIKSILTSLGYTYYLPFEMSEKNGNLFYNIRFKSEFILDPASLCYEIDQIYGKIIDVERIQENKWRYVISFENSNMFGIKKIMNNEKIRLKKPLKPYFLELQNGKTLQIISQQLNKWYPKIIFLNKDFIPLKIVQKERVYKGLTLKIPNDSKYVQIDDNFSLINIKRGITVIIRD